LQYFNGAIVLSLVLISAPATALSKFEIKTTEAKIAPILSEVAHALPLKIKNTINRSIDVRFVKTDSNKSIFFGCENEILDSAKSVAARIKAWGQNKNIRVIEVNENILPLLLQNPEEIHCGKTVREFFARTVTHELIHIYDLSLPVSENESAYLKKHCQKKKAPKAPVTPASALCQNMKRDFRLSESARFLSLDNWGRPSTNKNVKQTNSLDPYVFTHARESFAVHAEAFLYDPTFACRKPAFYQYYSEIFEHQPFSGPCEKLNTIVYTRNQKIDLDPSRLYEVHYLFAAKGKDVSSRWGHSMLRLVYCSPTRGELSEKCREDISHHKVISFRANIEDFQLNNIKGLTGKYPSQMFILSTNEVIKEYTQSELRDVYSLPLKLTEQEKSLLVARVLETYWTYRGRYYFLTNNCADETFSFLAGILSGKNAYAMQKFLFQDAGLIFPKELFNFYIQIGLANPMPKDQSELVSKGYYFPSSLKNLNIAAGIIFGNRPPEIEKYMDTSRPKERRIRFEESLAHKPDQQSKLASANYILETHILLRKQSQVRKEIAKKIKDNDPVVLAAFNSAKVTYHDTIENNIVQTQRAGYGIPDRASSIMDVSVLEPNAEPANFIPILLEIMPEAVQLLEGTEQNLKYFLIKTIPNNKHNPKEDL